MDVQLVLALPYVFLAILRLISGLIEGDVFQHAFLILLVIYEFKFIIKFFYKLIIYCFIKIIPKKALFKC